MGEGRRTGRVLAQLGEGVRPFTGRPDGEPDREAAIEREAFARGRKQGFDEGARQAGEELAQLAEEVRRELSAALEQLSSFETERRRENEKLVVEIALAAAARIVRERIAAGDPLAARALEEAIAALPPALKLRARIHPEDADAVAGRVAQETGRERLELVPDPAVSRGGCVDESDVGTIDASIETALDAVRDAVEGEAEAR